MKNMVTATELARNVGDILARVRYRHESFVVERNGRPIARIVPIEAANGHTVREAQEAWPTGAGDERTFADRVARGKAAARPVVNPSSASRGRRRPKRNDFVISRGRTPITADTVRNIDALDDRE